MNYQFKHIVVVHGIGDQAPNETVLGFMNEFIRALPTEGFKVTVDNLIENVDAIKDSVNITSDRKEHFNTIAPLRSFHPSYFIFTDLKKNIRHVIGFSEVYWKQIPDEYIKQNSENLPIPIFTWAHSVNTRLQGSPRRYHLAQDAINNIEKLLKLSRLFAVFGKKSDTYDNIVKKFLGDVQVYAESDKIRQDINNRFLEVMARVDEFQHIIKTKVQAKWNDPNINVPNSKHEIYVVSHSEGTVISLNSLVQAAILAKGSQSYNSPDYIPLFQFEEKLVKFYGNKAKASEWLGLVKGFVTLGSPIDKHYTIWSHRFRTDILTNHSDHNNPKIPWFNYWDQNDPVGYGLKEIFPATTDNQTDASKLFDRKFDCGFIRYFIPGLAHVGYWNDNSIYENIIHEVMNLGTTRKGGTVVKNKWWARFQQPIEAGAYILVRLLTLSIMIFYFSALLDPIKKHLYCWNEYFATVVNSVVCVYDVDIEVKYGGVIVVLLLLIKGLWQLYSSKRAVGESVEKALSGVPSKIIFAVRGILIGLLVITSFALCLSLKLPVSNASATISDYLGYLAGFGIFCLVWRLHTVVHRGLIQMWHYTSGAGTGVWEKS